jgi:selenocysteine lyase/cysteine desulfurase
MALDVREAFPAADTRLTSPVDGTERRLIYMDHAASTHAPQPVLDAHQRFLRDAYANVHRGAHHLSAVSTEAYEDVRWKCKAFVGARADQEILFTQNTTAALDLAAHLVADEPGRTLVTRLEHHSNDLPHRARGDVAHVDVRDDGSLDLADLEAKLAEAETRLVAVSMASNVTGIRPPLDRVVDLAHEHDARVLVDGAQGLAHLPISLEDIGTSGGPDLFAAPGHKAYAPMGSAFLVAPEDLLATADPYRPGGGTVAWVGDDDTVFAHGHDRHEGGTPNVPGAVAMGAALDFLRGLGLEEVREHEVDLVERALDGLGSIEGVTVLGDRPAGERVGALAFTVDDVHQGLVATILDHEHAIATRSGWFCAHPYVARLLGVHDQADALRERVLAGESARVPGFPGATRASLGVYNTGRDVDQLVRAVDEVARQDWTGDYTWSKREGWHLDDG